MPAKVSPATWACIILFLSIILYLPVVEHNYAHYDITVHYVVGLGWMLWLYSFSIRAKLGHVMYMLTPPHPLLDGPPAAFDDEAPTTSLLVAKPESPPYDTLAPTPNASKHERLFWRGRAGPGHLLFLLRLQMLSTAFPHLTQAQLTTIIGQMFQHCKDHAAFKQHLRDFLVQLKEFGDSSDLYADEQKAQDDDKAKNLRARQEAIPGLLNPHARNDDCMMGD